jgi:hypothetical protein
MLVGYMQVSKADGSQVTDLQRDALRKAGRRFPASLRGTPRPASATTRVDNLLTVAFEAHHTGKEPPPPATK